MTEKELKELIVKSIGVQSDNTDLVYRVFTKKIVNKLNPGEAIKIENVGTFNIAESDTAIGESGKSQLAKLLFVPAGENISDTETDKYFAAISIAAHKESAEFNPDSIFDIGVSRPLISSTELSEESASLKLIDDKVDELLNNSETLQDYKVWSETKIAETSETPADIYEVSEPDTDESITEQESFSSAPETADDPFVLPDFKSIEDDFSDDADAGIQIVSEDDIIVPGAEKVRDIEDESEEEIISDEDELIETKKDFEEPTEEEENLEDLFKDFESENDPNFETSVPDDLTDDFETPGMEIPSEIDNEENEVEESIDTADDVEKLDGEDDIASDDKSLDTDSANIDEDADLEETVGEEKDDKLDSIFDEVDEEFSEAKDSDDLDEFDDESTEQIDDLKNDELNLTEGEFEVENPDFDEEGIETLSASVEDTFDDAEKKIEDEEAEPEEDENETLPPLDEHFDDDQKDEVVEDESTEDEKVEPVLNDLPEEGEKILEPVDQESEYSKLRSGESKSSLGKGFWISVMIFIVVVVVGAYLYLFVYDSATIDEQSASVTETQVGKPEETIPPPLPVEEENQEQRSIEEIKKDLEDKRDIVKIQGKGDTGFYRDGTDEVRAGIGIFNKNGLYSVQVSSFKTQSVAENEAKKLQDRGYDAFIVKAFVPKFNADYYRVRVGYFNSKKEAEDFQTEF